MVKTKILRKKQNFYWLFFYVKIKFQIVSSVTEKTVFFLKFSTTQKLI